MPLPKNCGTVRALLPRPAPTAPEAPTSAISNTSGQPVFNTSGQGLTST